MYSRAVLNDSGTILGLDDFYGIDILGNMVEASILSPNPKYYGDMHNQMHLSLAFIHDPEHRYLVIQEKILLKLINS